MLLVSKLQAGKELRDQLLLKEEKNKLPTLVILLVSKLQAGNEVIAQLLLKERKKLSPGSLAESPNRPDRLGI